MNKGILITFSGIDGAGKSTQIKFLSEYLREKGRNVKVTEKMFGYFLLKPLIPLLRKTTGSPGKGPVSRNNKILPKLWFILAFIDIWFSYIINILPMLTKTDVLIADRFYTDIWANLLYYGYLPSWAFGVVKLLPKPDKALMLSVRPETVLRREREFPAQYYKKQAEIYNKLSLLLNFYVINADKNPDAVFGEIKILLSKTQRL